MLRARFASRVRRVSTSLATGFLVVAGFLTLLPAAPATAATGAQLATFVPPNIGNGRGMAFDGTDLYYTVVGVNRIYKVTTAGAAVATIPSAPPGTAAYGGPLAWDGSALWTMDYSGNSFTLYRVDPTDGHTLSSCNIQTQNSADPAVTSSPNIGDYPDGLDYENGTLWVSSEAFANNWVVQVDTNCHILKEFQPAAMGGYGTSGVAFDGVNLWHSYPHTPPSLVQTDVMGAPTGTSFNESLQLEDLAFDNVTFAPKCAIWGNEATFGSNNLTAYEVPCVGQADLAVTKTATVNNATSFDPLSPGNRHTVTFGITVNNSGPADAQSVNLKDTLPSEVTLVSATPSQGGPCTGTAPVSCPLGTIQNGNSANVTIKAAVNSGLRGGPVSTSNTAQATATTADPDMSNNSKIVNFSVFTVPDAPVLLSADAGNGTLGVVWKRGANPTGGDPVIQYDITATPSSGPVQMFVFTGDTPTTTNPDRFSKVLNVGNNGIPFSITIQARNNAGDSDLSNAISATPCGNCVVETVKADTPTTLNTGGGTKCPGPPPNSPGATTVDPIVSCYQFPASSNKTGAILAAREDPAVSGASGDCGPADTCIGNQIFFANPAGSAGTGPTLKWFALYDRTITTDVFGHPCLFKPCNLPFLYEYEVWFRQADGSAVMIGTSRIATWCLDGVIPAGKQACVKSLIELNRFIAPNGINGIRDLQVVVVFRGDPRGGLSG